MFNTKFDELYASLQENVKLWKLGTIRNIRLAVPSNIRQDVESTLKPFDRELVLKAVNQYNAKVYFCGGIFGHKNSAWIEFENDVIALF